VLQRIVEEIHLTRERLHQLEVGLATTAEQSDVCQRLQKIPGIGLIAATVFAGSVGDVSSFRSPRRFASWLGLTPREFSSGQIGRLGSIRNAVMDICGCYWYTEPALSCTRPTAHGSRGDLWMHCTNGPAGSKAK
jgi:transposase